MSVHTARLYKSGARKPSRQALRLMTRLPWASPSVREALIAMPGLLLVTGKHESAAEEHAAMLPVLKEVARMMAWTWLRVQAYYEQQNDK